MVDRAEVEVDVYRGCVELSTKDEGAGVVPGPFEVPLSRYVDGEVADSAGDGVKLGVGKGIPKCDDIASVGMRPRGFCWAMTLRCVPRVLKQWWVGYISVARWSLS